MRAKWSRFGLKLTISRSAQRLGVGVVVSAVETFPLWLHFRTAPHRLSQCFHHLLKCFSLKFHICLQVSNLFVFLPSNLIQQGWSQICFCTPPGNGNPDQGRFSLAHLFSPCADVWREHTQDRFRFGTSSLQRTDGCFCSQGSLEVCHLIWSSIPVNHRWGWEDVSQSTAGGLFTHTISLKCNKWMNI